MFSRTESLEREPGEIGQLAERLAAIPRTSDPALRAEARQLISKLHSLNQRWNIPEMREFLVRRQKEIFF